MTGDLFNAGFAWADEAAVSQPAATPPAIPTIDHVPSYDRAETDRDGQHVAGVAGVAETEGQRLERLLSQPNVARVATPSATAKTSDFCGVEASPRPAVAHVAGVANWEKGIASLDERYAPEGVAKADWKRLVRDSQHLMRLWGHDLHNAGWSEIEVFGVEPNMAHRRLDRCGLVFFVNGGEVEAIDGAKALICHGKDRLTFDRRGRNAGAAAIWVFSRRDLE